MQYVLKSDKHVLIIQQHIHNSVVYCDALNTMKSQFCIYIGFIFKAIDISQATDLFCKLFLSQHMQLM